MGFFQGIVESKFNIDDLYDRCADAGLFLNEPEPFKTIFSFSRHMPLPVFEVMWNNSEGLSPEKYLDENYGWKYKHGDGVELIEITEGMDESFAKKDMHYYILKDWHE